MVEVLVVVAAVVAKEPLAALARTLAEVEVEEHLLVAKMIEVVDLLVEEVEATVADPADLADQRVEVL